MFDHKCYRLAESADATGMIYTGLSPGAGGESGVISTDV